MSFVFDTMVLSELRKIEPSPKPIQWPSAQRAYSLFISMVNLGKVECGIEATRSEDAVSAAELEQWLEVPLSVCADRLLQESASTARLCGRLSATTGQDGADY